MALNVRTPGAGTPRVLGNVAVGTDDTPGFTAQPANFQASSIARRFGLPITTAAVIAELALASASDSWRANR